MLIKFLKHGTGDAAKAVDYVLGERDHTGALRAGVEVLRGDPAIVSAVAECLETKWRYSSAVIAFHPEDKPSAVQIQETLDEFEQSAYAGLDADRGCWSAIQHVEDDGSVHVHVLAARVDLATGKAYNPAPPGWQKQYGALSTWLNLKHQWRDPNEKKLARELRPANRNEATQGIPQDKQEIHDYITERIAQGEITNRKEMVDEIKTVGLTVHREGKDYISVRLPDAERSIRLKGEIYGAEWELARSSERESQENGRNPGRNITSNGEHGEVLYRDVATARDALDNQRKRCAEFNRDKYPEPRSPRFQGLEVGSALRDVLSLFHGPNHTGDRIGKFGTSESERHQQASRGNIESGSHQKSAGEIQHQDQEQPRGELDRSTRGDESEESNIERQTTNNHLGAIDRGRDDATFTEHIERAARTNRGARKSNQNATAGIGAIGSIIRAIENTLRDVGEAIKVLLGIEERKQRKRIKERNREQRRLERDDDWDLGR